MDEMKIRKALWDIRLYESEADLPLSEQLPRDAEKLPEAAVMERAMEFRKYLRFCRDVDHSLTHKSRYDAVYVGKTPPLYISLGLSQLPVLLTPAHINTMIKKHGLSAYDIKRLPYELMRPVAVFDSTRRLDCISILTGLKDRENNPLIVQMKPGGIGIKEHREVASNFILSFYGKRAFQELLQNASSSLLFWQKERSKLLGDAQTPCLRAFSNLASGIILRQSGAIVKPDPQKHLTGASFFLSRERPDLDIAFALRFIWRFTLGEIAQIKAQAPSACFLATRAEYAAALPDADGFREAGAPILVRPGEKPILISAGGGILEFFDIRQTNAGNSLSARLCLAARPGLMPELVKKGLAMALSGGAEEVIRIYPAARELFLTEQAGAAGGTDAADLSFRASIYAAGIELQTYGGLDEPGKEDLKRSYAVLSETLRPDPESLALDLTVTLEKACGDIEIFQENGREMRRAEEAFQLRDQVAMTEVSDEQAEGISQ